MLMNWNTGSKNEFGGWFDVMICQSGGVGCMEMMLVVAHERFIKITKNLRENDVYSEKNRYLGVVFWHLSASK